MEDILIYILHFLFCSVSEQATLLFKAQTSTMTFLQVPVGNKPSIYPTIIIFIILLIIIPFIHKMQLIVLNKLKKENIQILSKTVSFTFYQADFNPVYHFWTSSII